MLQMLHLDTLEPQAYSRFPQTIGGLLVSITSSRSKKILNEMEFEIVDFYDVEAFYEYMGNPDIQRCHGKTKKN